LNEEGRLAADFGPDKVNVVRLNWPVPWNGGQAKLTVAPLMLSRDAVISVNDEPLLQFKRPTLDKPWTEQALTGSEPPLKVVQIAFPGHRFKTVVFADGISVSDARSEADWRAAAPSPMDDFEMVFGATPYFGPKAAVLLGLVVASPLLAVSILKLTPQWLPIVIGCFVVVAGWEMLTYELIRWLIPRRTWPSTLRKLLVLFTFIGIPLLAIGAVQSLTVR
jgi:hypothetical protein